VSRSAKDQSPSDAELAGYRRTVARLPLTVRPSVNEQLNKWPMLFPFERGQLENFLRGVEAFTPAEFNAVMAPLETLEAKMGVAHWRFSETSNTMENSGQLARSPYYAEWRQAVQELFKAVNAKARQGAAGETERGRAIVLVLPAGLPVEERTAFSHWEGRGRRVAIDGDAREFVSLLKSRWQDYTDALSAAGAADASDAWVIDGEGVLEQAIHPTAVPGALCLSWAQIDPFRRQFLADVNVIPRDIHTASDTMTLLERRDWSEWWPHELAGQDRLKNFMVDTYLSGNGALIFSNAFAQWTSSEVLRRARPRLLVARFGLRNKPKPFTSIALFEDQTKVSPLPDTPDPENSAIDAAILAHYVGLAAQRYTEYQRALVVCVAEHLNAAWVIAPQNAPLATGPVSLSPAQLHRAVLDALRA
jgi:hypothetical protein